MNCPVDGTTLAMSDRSGIEIDYCPQCRGVWLDRGELDKIIERAEPSVAAPPPAAAYRPDRSDDRDRDRSREQGYNQNYDRDRDRDRDRDKGYGDKDYKKKKKGGILGEMFDF